MKPLNNYCSDQFFDAFSAGWGSRWVDCGCGRHYMATLENNIAEEIDYVHFLEQAHKDPDHYIDTGHGGVSLINLGREYVNGCSCGTVVRHEDWIWEHRDRIMKYIKARSAGEVSKAEQEALKLKQYAEM